MSTVTTGTQCGARTHDPGIMSPMSCQHSTTKVQVQLQNFTDKPLTIPSKSVLCALNRVEIPDSDDLVESDSVVGTDDQSLLDMFDFSQCVGSPSEIKQLQRLIIRWKSVLSLNDLDIGHSDVVKHQINLVDETPIKLPPSEYSTLYG